MFWLYFKYLCIIIFVCAVIFYDFMAASVAFHMAVNEDMKYRELWLLLCVFGWPFMLIWKIGGYIYKITCGVKQHGR